MSLFHMSSRTKRRLVVSGYYALVLAIAAVFFGLVVKTNIPRSAVTAQQIPSINTVAVWFGLLIFSLIVCTWFFRTIMVDWRWMKLRPGDPRIDERMAARRNQAFFYAFRIFVFVYIVEFFWPLLWSYLPFAKPDTCLQAIFQGSFMENITIFLNIVLVLTLPIAVAAWMEPYDADELIEQ